MGSKSTRYGHFLDLKYDYCGGTSSPSPSFLVNSFERVGADLPNYLSVMKSGGNATTPMTVTAKRFSLHTGGLTVRNRTHPQNPCYGSMPTCRQLASVYAITEGSASPDLVSKVDNAALMGIIKKIRSHQQSDFSGPIFLVELRKTVRGLLNPLRVLREQLNLFVNLERRMRLYRQGKRDRNWAETISSTWLEFSFGIKPAIADITAICNILNGQLSKRPGVSRVSYKFADNEASQSDEGVAPIGVEAWAVLRTRTTVRYSCQYQLGLKRGYPSLDKLETPVQNLLDFSRFDLGEVLPTVWEAIPFSWLIDYVTNVGDLLGCSFDYNQSIQYGSCTKKTEFRVLRFAASAGANPWGELVAFDPEKFNTSYDLLSRTPVNELGFPRFEFSLPSIGQANNALQLLISLASSKPLKG